jgi:cytochrome c biogenesis protein ResB
VNDPLVYGGVKFYQASYGWAPEVRVTAGDKTFYEGPVVALPGGPGGSSEAVLRIPQLQPNVGLRLDFYPDPVIVPPGVPGAPPPAPDEDPAKARPLNLSDVPGGSDGMRFGNTPALGVPILVVRGYTGDLRADLAQNVFTLDTAALRPAGGDLLVPGAVGSGGLSDTSVDLGGVRVQFLGARRYSVLSVKADPGLPVVGLAAALIVLGLVPSLVAWRRRLWVHVVEREGEATLIELGGLAYQRKERFDDEFTAVALRLRHNLPPVLEREPVP